MTNAFTSPPAQTAAALKRSPLEVRRADDRDDPARLARDPLERRFGGSYEARPQQEILRRIAGHGELREERDVGAGRLRLAEPLEDERAIAVEIADDGVDLRKCDAHRYS